MTSPSSLDALVEQCILALESGDQAAVDKIVSEHPDDAPALRERLAQLQALGILDAPKPTTAVPEHLGDFRLLRQIGRGGMGVVYLAEQTALQRKVALKLVHPQQLFFQGARERFRREVLAVARLNHPGIVPILTCGEANDIPYYAMELVAGASLAEIVHELVGSAPASLDGTALRSAQQRAMAKKHDLSPVGDAPVFAGAWAAVVARLLLAAARALHHAHEQGVLHRDIKPSNLLLATDGAVRLIDFGLASAEGEQRLTRSGATFGSVPYMAPEQVRGDVAHIDVRTDVYALGVTLYELLTLTLPHGDGSGQTRERILAGRVEPPTRRNPAIHPDLEAICLTALAAEPHRRYPSAAALAEDLQAFLEQRSVTARRPSLLLRGRRWIRRSPARATALAAAFVLLVPGPLVLAWQQHDAAGRIQAALDETERQRAATETSLDNALAAVDQLLLRTAEARLAEVPRMAKLRRQLLEDAIALQQRLVDSSAAMARGDQRARVQQARAKARLGDLLADLGELKRAESELRTAVAVLEEVLPTATKAQHVRRELANAYDTLAAVLGQANHLDETEKIGHRAIELYHELRLQGGPEARNAGEGEIRAMISVANTLGASGRFVEALAQLDRIDEQFAPDGAGAELAEVDRLELWIMAADHRGVTLAQAGESDRAFEAFTEALRRVDTATPDLAVLSSIVRARIGVLERLGLICHQRFQWERAAPFLDEVCAAYDALVTAEPDFPAWRAKLAKILGTRADNRRRLDDAAGCTADHDRCIALLEQVCRESPDAPDYPNQLAIAYGERAMAQPDGPLAEADYVRSEQILERSIAQGSGDQQVHNNLAATLANHASSRAALEDIDGARTLVDRAIAVLRARSNNESKGSLIEILAMAGDLALRSGDHDEARRLTDSAAELAASWIAERPEDTLRRRVAARLAVNRGILLVNLGDLPAAIPVWEAGLPDARIAAKDSPIGRQSLALLLLRLADAARREDDVATMRRWFQAAIAETGVRRKLVEHYEPVVTLFDDPRLQDLVPKPASQGQAGDKPPSK